MKLFRKSSPEPEAEIEADTEPTEIIERAEIATIEVRDIKQYLVDEYERSNNLHMLNNRLKKQMAEAEQEQIKHDAALVTLDEFKRRIEQQEAEILNLEASVETEKRKAKQAREEANTMQIKLNRMDLPLVIDGVKDEIMLAVLSQKGPWSKGKVQDIITDTEIVVDKGVITTRKTYDE